MADSPKVHALNAVLFQSAEHWGQQALQKDAPTELFQLSLDGREYAAVAAPLLAQSRDFQSGQVSINVQEVMDEVFGAVGYRDGGKRFIKLPGRLLADVHQAFKIGGGAALRCRAIHMHLPWWPAMSVGFRSPPSLILLLEGGKTDRAGNIVAVQSSPPFRPMIISCGHLNKWKPIQV